MSEIRKRKIVTLNRAFGDTDTWAVCERANDVMWVSHQGDVYTTKQLDILITELRKLQKYIRGRKGAQS